MTPPTPLMFMSPLFFDTECYEETLASFLRRQVARSPLPVPLDTIHPIDIVSSPSWHPGEWDCETSPASLGEEMSPVVLHRSPVRQRVLSPVSPLLFTLLAFVDCLPRDALL
ncbi:hypothetical protein ACFE04_001778 [Oxalis oulophora]